MLLIVVYDAITQAVRVSPSQISFNDTSSLDYITHNLTVTNDAIYPVSYNFYSNISTAIEPYNRTGSIYNSLNQPSVNREAIPIIDFSVSEIYLNPGESQIVTVTVTPPNTDPQDHVIYGGYIHFVPLNQNDSNSTHYVNVGQAKPIHIPYIGIAGRQRDLPILGSDIHTYYYSETYVNKTENQITYKFNPKVSYDKLDYFVIVEFDLINPTKMITAELVQLPSMDLLGYVMLPNTDMPATPRGSDLYIGWNGYYFNSSAANIDSEKVDTRYAIPSLTGSYSLQLKALKLFGNPEQEDNWDMWRSGIINIERID